MAGLADRKMMTGRLALGHAAESRSIRRNAAGTGGQKRR